MGGSASAVAGLDVSPQGSSGGDLERHLFKGGPPSLWAVSLALVPGGREPPGAPPPSTRGGRSCGVGGGTRGATAPRCAPPLLGWSDRAFWAISVFSGRFLCFRGVVLRRLPLAYTIIPVWRAYCPAQTAYRHTDAQSNAGGDAATGCGRHGGRARARLAVAAASASASAPAAVLRMHRHHLHAACSQLLCSPCSCTLSCSCALHARRRAR